MIYIGTSGYSYQDWVGSFYPEGMKNHEFLAFYARNFPALEVNATYSRMPDAYMFESMLRHTESKIRFAVKCHESITHKKEINQTRIKSFTNALRPLKLANQLGCILMQFPYGFLPSTENRNHLIKLREAFKYFPVSVEFRNPKWHREDIGLFFRQLDAGFCITDEPETPKLSAQEESTRVFKLPGVSLAYFRLHGKNKKGWWTDPEEKQNTKNLAQRYTYSYSSSELLAITRSLEPLADRIPDIYVFFNNSPRGHAPKNAQEFRNLLLGSSIGSFVT